MDLSHLTVIELSSVLAGPAVGMFFAELGARVIKIENATTGGDVTRRWKLPQEDPEAEYSAYYCSVNWGKEIELVDLKDPAGKERIYELVRGADIVISNFKPASSVRMGMDYAQLSSLNDSLIYAQLTGFGPEDGRPAFDVVLQAEAGFLHMTGTPGGPPAKMPVALIDLLAAHQLKEGILLALLQRKETGKGCFLQTSLLEAAIASLANQATNWLMAGHIPTRMGCQHPNIAPYGDVFTTNDGKALVIAAGTENQFQSLCDALEREDLKEDERFRTNAVRVENRIALVQELTPAFAMHSLATILDMCRQRSIPVGQIRDMQEVFEQPMAQNMILEETDKDGRITRRVRTFTIHWA